MMSHTETATYCFLFQLRRCCKYINLRKTVRLPGVGETDFTDKLVTLTGLEGTSKFPKRLETVKFPQLLCTQNDGSFVRVDYEVGLVNNAR